MPKKISVTVLVNDYVKERRSFEIKNLEDLRGYSFYLLDVRDEYGEDAVYRITEEV